MTNRPSCVHFPWGVALLCFVVLAGCLFAPAQTQNSSVITSKIDQCPGPWRVSTFEGFAVGMRIPGGLDCFYRSIRPNKYIRTTSANAYSINPKYEDDSTESRLHPDYVLSSVDVIVDRPKPL